jgi:hypothetical protein
MIKSTLIMMSAFISLGILIFMLIMRHDANRRMIATQRVKSPKR